MEGFIVSRWGDRWFEGIEKNMAWIREGKLKYRETVTEGFENMFQAFDGMLRGDNFGKAVVKVWSIEIALLESVPKITYIFYFVTYLLLE